MKLKSAGMAKWLTRSAAVRNICSSLFSQDESRARVLRGFDSPSPLPMYVLNMVIAYSNLFNNLYPSQIEMKKVYLIHGWSGSSEGGWFDWLKEELGEKGFEVTAFDMPNTDKPKIEEWVGYLRENINSDEIDEHTYFIGHSIGCQTIIRFLEKLHKHKKIAGCVFVAGWFNLINLEQEELEIAHPWINSEIDFERILDHCNNFLAIFSDNDPYVSLNESEKFKKNLGAKIIIKKKCGHFEEKNKILEILKFLK